MTFDPAKFFASIRSPQRCGPLKTTQVEGFNEVLQACEGAPLAHAAYMLATAWHETAGTMQPIKEYGGSSYFHRMYDIGGDRPALARANGNTTPGDGVKYYGRGYVQLTWKVNYEKAGKKLGVDLVGHPDLALASAHAAKILRNGMAEGWFTGKKLATYLPSSGTATRAQYVAARKIINGTDKAELVEDYAQWFERALRDGGWS